jgi:hypothetical protein
MSRPKKNEELSPIAQFIWDSRAGIDQANHEARQILKSRRDMEKSVTQPILDASESMGISLPEAPAQLVSLIREGRQIAEAINGGGLPEKRRTKRNVRDIERQIEPAIVPTLGSIEAHEETSQKDGPIAGGFRFEGRPIQGKLSGMAWKLVNYLWQCPNREATFDDLAEKVWDDSQRDGEEAKGKFRSPQSTANKFFKANGIPFKVIGDPKPHLKRLPD